jgi:dTDP-4-dehydrorhamnose 3,5-epimerase
LPYTLTPYRLPGLLVVEGRSFPDDRGFFMESYREVDFAGTPIPKLVQDNLSRSKRGVLRGLHYQKNPAAIGKLVRCVSGKIFDVAVDLRKGSPTYGKWASIELDGEGNRMFWVPAGFAHGFYTMSDVADVMYKVTGYWSAEVDRGILWSDPEVGVKWPGASPIVTAKDSQLPPLSRADNDFTWP